MKKTMQATLSWIALVAATMLPSHLGAQSEVLQGSANQGTITVEVQNGNWLDMRVYAVRENGASDRIGTVTSFSSRKFELPRWLSGDNTEIKLVAVPIGANQRYASQPVIVSNGDVIEWNLGNNLSLSSIFVRAAG